METTYTYRPPFPVITTNPTLEQALAATTKKDWLQAFGISAGAAAIAAVATRPFSVKYGMSLVAFGTVGTIAAMGVLKNSCKRLEGYEPNEEQCQKFPYRLDIPDEQVRVEPFRMPTREELEEIIRNPRQ